MISGLSVKCRNPLFLRPYSFYSYRVFYHCVQSLFLFKTSRPREKGSTWSCAGNLERSQDLDCRLRSFRSHLRGSPNITPVTIVVRTSFFCTPALRSSVSQTLSCLPWDYVSKSRPAMPSHRPHQLSFPSSRTCTLNSQADPAEQLLDLWVPACFRWTALDNLTDPKPMLSPLIT